MGCYFERKRSTLCFCKWVRKGLQLESYCEEIEWTLSEIWWKMVTSEEDELSSWHMWWTKVWKRIHHICYILFKHSPAVECLGCSHCLATVNRSVHISLWDPASFLWYVLCSGFVGSCSNSIFNVLNSCHCPQHLLFSSFLFFFLSLFFYGHSNRYEVIFIVVLISIL